MWNNWMNGQNITGKKMKPGRNFTWKNVLESLCTLLTAVNLRPIVCSIVLDGMDRNVVQISDYCPKMPYCEEGSHIICMYYNPNRVAGPDCIGFMNITITKEIALNILEIVNAIRSKVAQGKETGKNGQYLPKGYGLMRIKWDSELATFAQVLANQCGRKGDFCRSSNRFPDPEQNLAVIRFARPNWVLTVRQPDAMMKKIDSPDLQKPGFNGAKVKYGVYKMLESWYELKNLLEPFLVLNYPNFTIDPTHWDIKRISNIISGSATHIGCGISAFSHYTHHNKTRSSYNSIVLICNISGRPKPGQSIYETEPPSRVGYTIRCGCPPGYEEDEDCLCYESPSSTNTSTSCIGNNKNCKPAVVLLPIVTAEDAPPPEYSRLRHNQMEFHVSEHEANKHDDIFGNNDHQRRDVSNELKESKHENYKDIWTKPKIKDVTKRYFNKGFEKVWLNHEKDQPYYSEKRYLNLNKDDNLGYRRKTNDSPTQKNRHYSKGSLFSRMPKFELPQTYSHKRPLKSDVAPRKNFKNTNILLEQYLKTRKVSGIKMSGLSSSTSDNETTAIHTADVNKYFSNKFNYQGMKDSKNYEQTNLKEIESFTEATDKNFMNLLDKLEQQVKHIELNMQEKEIVDAKIRKIYGHIVGKSVDTLASKNMYHDLAEEPKIDKKDDFVKYETAVDNHLAMENLVKTKSFLPQTRPQKNLGSKDNLNPFSKSAHDKLSDLVAKRRSFKASIYQTSPKRNPFTHENINAEELPSFNLKRNTLIDESMKNYGKDEFLSEDNARNIFDEVHNRKRPSSNSFDNERKRKDFETLNGDVLDVDRKKYYQEKLERIQRKFQPARGFNNRNEHERERQRRLAWSGLRRQDNENNNNMEFIPNRPEKLHSNYYEHDRPRRLQDL